MIDNATAFAPKLWLFLCGFVGLLAPDSGSLRQEIEYSDHFHVFTGDGKPASLADLVNAMADADVVLVGESHTDPVGHWLEAELLSAALERFGDTRPVALSLEMFERDVQYIVDEYLQDMISEQQFKASTRPWKFYDEDYRAMVELAKEANIPVIAANAPRRYVNRVTRHGRESLDDLPAAAKSFLPPLPFPEPSEAYRQEWQALMARMPMERQCIPPVSEPATKADSVVEPPPAEPPAAPSPHMGSFMENGVQAQALWDASMAHAITSYLEAEPGALVLHMVGGFHVDNFTGIPEKVEYYRSGTRSLVVAMDNVADFGTFDPAEFKGRGDFVILTDKSLDLEYQRFCTEDNN